MKFAFISRHEPTPEQAAIAAEQGIDLVAIGDCDAFSVTPTFIRSAGQFAGVVVVHPAAALRLCADYRVGVFENEMRAALGEKPAFKAKAFYVWDLRDESQSYQGPGDLTLT